MTKDKLRRYQALVRERTDLDNRIEKLYKRIERLPDITDKVEASMSEWPYTRIHIPVRAKPPREMNELHALIRNYERNLEAADKTILEIENYIDSIEDAETRNIFRMVFIDGMTYREVGDAVSMDYSNIAKRIEKQLSTNSTK